MFVRYFCFMCWDSEESLSNPAHNNIWKITFCYFFSLHIDRAKHISDTRAATTKTKKKSLVIFLKRTRTSVLFVPLTEHEFLHLKLMLHTLYTISFVSKYLLLQITWSIRLHTYTCEKWEKSKEQVYLRQTIWYHIVCVCFFSFFSFFFLLFSAQTFAPQCVHKYGTRLTILLLRSYDYK